MRSTARRKMEEEFMEDTKGESEMVLQTTPAYLLSFPIRDHSLSLIIFHITSSFATSWAFQIHDDGLLTVPSQLP